MRAEQFYSSLKLGEICEKAVELYCNYNNIPFLKASKDENLNKGIDAYINNIPCDIKATKRIFIGNLRRIDGEYKFILRHPFRVDTKAENYVFVSFNMNIPPSQWIRINQPINEFLYNNQFTNELAGYAKLIRFLDKYNNKAKSDFDCISEKAFITLIKIHILNSNLLTKIHKIIYDEPKDNIKEWSLYLE